LGDKIREGDTYGACNTDERERRDAYRALVGEPRRRWEYNIKMELKGIGWEVWTAFTQSEQALVAGSCGHRIS
jgi:hypothetical protein